MSVNALLGPLQNNGGPTRTHALLAGSPAINAGNDCVLIANACGDGNSSFFQISEVSDDPALYTLAPSKCKSHAEPDAVAEPRISPPTEPTNVALATNGRSTISRSRSLR